MFAFIIQLRIYFSENKRKQNLKTDLEILSLTEKSNLQEIEIVRKRVKEQISVAYNQELRGNNNVSNIITGLIVFTGFGFWTAYLFKNSYPNFNPWSILTLFCSIAGLSMLLFDNEKVEKIEPFIIIGVYDKPNLKFALVVIITCGIILTFLILINDHFTYGIFFNGLFCLIAIMAIIKNIKKIK